MMGWAEQKATVERKNKCFKLEYGVTSNSNRFRPRFAKRSIYVQRNMPTHHFYPPTTPNSPIPIRTLTLLLLLSLPFSTSSSRGYAGCVYIIAGGFWYPAGTSCSFSLTSLSCCIRSQQVQQNEARQSVQGLPSMLYLFRILPRFMHCRKGER